MMSHCPNTQNNYGEKTQKNKETLQTIYTLKKEREIIVYYHNDCDYYFDDDWLSVAVRGTIILSISYTMCVCRTGCCKESRGGHMEKREPRPHPVDSFFLFLPTARTLNTNTSNM
jgi:hypothetical protein